MANFNWDHFANDLSLLGTRGNFAKDFIKSSCLNLVMGKFQFAVFLFWHFHHRQNFIHHPVRGDPFDVGFGLDHQAVAQNGMGG